MKNLLLLFLVSFALLWVGCEKEELAMTPVPEQLQRSFDQLDDSYGANESYSRNSSPEECDCAFVSPTFTVERGVPQNAIINGMVVVEEAIRFTVDFSTPEATGSEPEEQGSMTFEIFLNGEPFTDPPTFNFNNTQVTSGDCFSDPFPFSIANRRLGECPDVIELKTSASLNGNIYSEGAIPCFTRKIARFEERLIVSNPDEACPIGEDRRSPPTCTCYDEFGTPYECPCEL